MPSELSCSAVGTHAHKCGKFRRAFPRKATVTVGNQRADFGRVVAVFVLETAADAEFAVSVLQPTAPSRPAFRPLPS